MENCKHILLPWNIFVKMENCKHIQVPCNIFQKMEKQFPVRPNNYGQTPLGQLPLGQTPLGQLPLGQLPLEQTTLGQLLHLAVLDKCRTTSTKKLFFFTKNFSLAQFLLHNLNHPQRASASLRVFARVFFFLTEFYSEGTRHPYKVLRLFGNYSIVLQKISAECIITVQPKVGVY